MILGQVHLKIFILAISDMTSIPLELHVNNF